MSFRRELQREQGWETNKSTHFLLPIVGFPKSYYTEHLINSYIVPGDTLKLAIVFENIEDELLQVQLYRLNNYHRFVDMYLDDDEQENVVTLELDEIWREDYVKFLDGSYSKFSKKLKDTLVRIHGKTTAVGVTDYGLPKVSMFDVIYPSKEKLGTLEKALEVVLEKREVFDKPDYERELYRTVTELKDLYPERIQVK